LVGVLSDIGKNNFLPDGALLIANAIALNKSLTSLVIDECSIKDKGIETIAESLASNTTLLSIGTLL
jgi:hypothetical protein